MMIVFPRIAAATTYDEACEILPQESIGEKKVIDVKLNQNHHAIIYHIFFYENFFINNIHNTM